MSDRRCKICDRLIPVQRLRRFPNAVLCGSPPCDVEHQKRRHNRKQATWRRARGERDPAWRAHLIAQAGVRYLKRKALRQTTERAAVNTAPPANWAEALERLCVPALRHESLCDGGRKGDVWRMRPGREVVQVRKFFTNPRKRART